MGIHVQRDAAGFHTYTLTHGEDTAVVSAFGGQLLSWTRRGVPILFENRERAVVDGKTPYRGGAPICFSHFGMGTLLPLGTTVKPQHGHARTSVWEAEVVADGVTLKTIQPSPEGYGPTQFRCELTYRLADTLTLRANVLNAGQFEAPFQLAVHSYWAAADPSDVTVEGLGSRYLDNLLGLTEHTETDSSKPHPAPFDRVYLEESETLRVRTDRYELKIETRGGSGAVLWNPGKDHTIKDLGSPDFICVEVGRIVPAQNMAPGEEYPIEMSFGVQLL